ncbi:hypothetical protein ASPWEDRAFT_41764 [Aspergillus wentii DTO 134E9]|uniref:Uncharacterized protein n=1 Tax=Aspergillus wentii DTO 134E9 TaxID=1073089 RepID=A0A1L9RG31_ASPWE|nr:uncharacterized protein ASPWEDRAFT_41764 [Aspergillus wentii DTO 134E9]KAI9925643.1 hypothetical protein MW887_006026 [Aspergillus wentii]OJJ33881.1 hypothetical protein ASPWEDRAFT_41764 [Aspergillus wentii DTO 134E9]
MDSVKGKVYTITGLAGMGLAVARLLHSNGARLSLADIDETALTNALAVLGPDTENIMTTPLDIGSSSAVKAWIEATIQKFGRLDGAANMAGTIGKKHGVGALIDQDDEEWDMLIRVNLSGTMYCLREQIRGILATSGTGSIVNATSIQGLKGFALHAAYSTTKHGVVGLTNSVSKEVGPAIRVNAIAPGVIQTPLLDKAAAIQGGLGALTTSIPRVGTSNEVAQAALFLLSDASSYTTGTVLNVDGGWE